MGGAINNFLVGGASSSLLIILAVVVFAGMMVAKMSSFKMAIAAFVLVGVYAILDSYKSNAVAIGNDGKIIGEEVVCVDGLAYKRNQGSLFSSENLTLLLDANGSSLKCRKIGDIK